jgi:hypothetical protein
MGFDGEHTILIGIEFKYSEFMDEVKILTNGCNCNNNYTFKYCPDCGKGKYTRTEYKIKDILSKKYNIDESSPYEILKQIFKEFDMIIPQYDNTDFKDRVFFVGKKIISICNRNDWNFTYSFSEFEKYKNDQNLINELNKFNNHKSIIPKIYIINTSSW